MIALIDYGAGNLTSVRKALSAIGAEVEVPREPSELDDAMAVIVPGVGNFQSTAAMNNRWRQGILDVVGRGRPLLGICLGLQWLFEGSTEAPACQGLALMTGQCDRLEGGVEVSAGRSWPLKIPHVGWNALHFPRASRLFEGLEEGSQVYFTHSYAAPVTTDAVAVTAHGRTFASGVERGHVFGVQFHPEKSGDAGLRVLRNFLNAV
ncbi:MAG: imidazole glycerol phosphate synthase subunit HisH [Vicinamibacterales bacterium]|nr:imidazole glycerol phosphate synthase subunit HisH [Vicinamibacterales bacterium]